MLVNKQDEEQLFEPGQIVMTAGVTALVMGLTLFETGVCKSDGGAARTCSIAAKRYCREGQAFPKS